MKLSHSKVKREREATRPIGWSVTDCASEPTDAKCIRSKSCDNADLLRVAPRFRQVISRGNSEPPAGRCPFQHDKVSPESLIQYQLKFVGLYFLFLGF